MAHAVQKHYKTTNTFNALFLPGLPRPYMERPLIANLVSRGSNIYTVVYPGTYDAPGEVSPDSITQAIQDAIAYLNKTGMPLLVIAYSFSTGYALQAALGVKNPLGFVFFSPTIDLKYDSRDDFYSVTARMNESSDINMNAKKFTFADTWEVAVQAYYKKLDALAKSKVRIVFISGEKDPALKSEIIVGALEQYRKTRNNKTITVMNVPEAGHNLDELYATSEVKSLLRDMFTE